MTRRHDKGRVVVGYCEKSVSKTVGIAMKNFAAAYGKRPLPQNWVWCGWEAQSPFFITFAFIRETGVFCSTARAPGPHTPNKLQIGCRSIVAVVPHNNGRRGCIDAAKKPFFPCLPSYVV
jgi:hypothetical protein